jgi:hypothetical protein
MLCGLDGIAMSEGTIKLSVLLSTESVEQLRETAISNGTTMTEAFRQALELLFYFDKEASQGTKFLLETKGTWRSLWLPTYRLLLGVYGRHTTKETA